MKLFQQLLVAPAALGLLAPLAANAADLDVKGISDYASSTEVQNFADIHPNDWAFKALTSLAERSGCAVATPSGSITRFEAATLLNKCLGNVAQVSEEERRLINEFAPEIAIIKGRIDGLESRVGEFEAGQFSKTTVLRGTTTFVVGGVSRNRTGDDDAVSMTYSTKFDLNTSLTGSDLLYTRIRDGNMTTSTPWGSKTNGTYLAAANDDSALTVDKLWYTAPIGNFRVWVGPKVENYYMLASAPSIYKPVLKQFALGGNGATYGSSTDGGFGVAWTQPKDDPSAPRFAVSTNFASKSASNSTNGILGDGQTKWLSKVEYGSPRWQVSLGYASHGCTESANSAASVSCKVWTDYYATQKGSEAGGNSETAWALRGYWQPEENGFVPSVQVGYDVRSIDGTASGEVKETAQWMIGLMWKDVLVDGNRAGIAFGARQYATEFNTSGTDNADDNLVWEAYYDFKVNDYMTVTPAVFGGTDTYDGDSSNEDDIFGALIQTTFKF